MSQACIRVENLVRGSTYAAPLDNQLVKDLLTQEELARNSRRPFGKPRMCGSRRLTEPNLPIFEFSPWPWAREPGGGSLLGLRLAGPEVPTQIMFGSLCLSDACRA